MTALERTKALLAEGTDESLIELTRVLRGKAPGPEEKEALAALATDTVPAEHLVRALHRAGAVGRRYEENAAPPYDLRSRMVVQDLLRAASTRRIEAVRPLVVQLLGHPDLAVWAAHALGRLGGPGAVDAALAAIASSRGTARGVLVRLVLADDPARAYDLLAPSLEDPEIAAAFLRELWRDLSDRRRAKDGGRPWIDDARHVALAERTRDATTDRELQAMLVDLVAGADPSLRSRREPTTKKKRAKPTSAKPTAAVLDRARAEMKEVAADVANVVESLRASGYRFVAEPHVPPPRTVKSQLQRLEREVGPLPTTVRAFVELVGAVDLRGTHPSWPATGTVLLAPEPHVETDPLVVAPLGTALEALEDHREGVPFVWRLVPDALSKAGFSAGPGYGVVCGTGEVDPVLEGDPSGRRFLEHVRHALANGGFGAPAAVPAR